MGEGVAQPAQNVQGPLHRGIDQPKPAGQGYLGANGAKRTIRQKQAIVFGSCWCQHRLQQMLKGCIYASHPHENRTTATLLEHL